MEMAEREGQEEAVREKKEEENQKIPKNGDGGKAEEEEEEEENEEDEEDLLPESFGQRQTKDKQTRPAAEKVFVDIDELEKSYFTPEN